MDATLAVALLALAGTIITTFIQIRSTKDKTSAETDSEIVDQAAVVAKIEGELRENIKKQFDEYRKAAEKQISDQDDKIRELNERIDQIQKDRDAEIRRLKAELRKHQRQLDIFRNWIRAQGVDPEKIEAPK